LAHDILPGVKAFASWGVFVKSLNPQRMSFDNLESSSEVSVNGFCGMSHAVTIVVEAGISVSARRGTPLAVVLRGVPWQAAAAQATRTATSDRLKLK
jgi:hypothetical protein